MSLARPARLRAHHLSRGSDEAPITIAAVRVAEMGDPRVVPRWSLAPVARAIQALRGFPPVQCVVRRAGINQPPDESESPTHRLVGDEAIGVRAMPKALPAPCGSPSTRIIRFWGPTAAADWAVKPRRMR
jgi:hypothetical protein